MVAVAGYNSAGLGNPQTLTVTTLDSSKYTWQARREGGCDGCTPPLTQEVHFFVEKRFKRSELIKNIYTVILF